MYVGTLSHTTWDDYLTRRGFHWYAYDVEKGKFSDLSASQPGGVGAQRGGLVTIAADPSRHLIYGAINPTGDILRYHIGSGRSERIGRPDYQRRDVYPGRFMWVDSRGRLYFSAGNDEEKHYGAPYDPAIFNHIRYYDPAKSFGEMPNWALHNQRAIDAGECFPKERVCYLSDNVGHIYKFTEAGPTWRYLGSIGQESIIHGNPSYNYTWVFHVTSDRKKAYIVTSRNHFYELILALASLISLLISRRWNQTGHQGLFIRTRCMGWQGTGSFLRPSTTCHARERRSGGDQSEPQPAAARAASGHHEVSARFLGGGLGRCDGDRGGNAPSYVLVAAS